MRKIFACDLVDKPELIKEYKEYHADKIWPEIPVGIKSTGVEVLDIYNFGNRMFLLLETGDDWTQEKADEWE